MSCTARDTARARRRREGSGQILLTMTPGGFKRTFKDRVELFKTSKPDDPDFRKKRRENAVKGNYDVEFLADWELPK